MDEPARDDDPVSLDTVMELLASRWCRYALYEIYHEESLAPEKLVRRVAAREYDDPDADQHETVRTRLHHNSLPKLDAHDFVEWDVDEITRGECAPLAEPYVEWSKEWEVDQ